MKICQNDWSEFGKGFIVKIRKNTGFLPCNYAYHIRKYAQKFSKTDIYNIININNIQNKESPKMNTTRRRLASTQFWEDPTLETLENLRESVRTLMMFLDSSAGGKKSMFISAMKFFRMVIAQISLST